MEFLTDEIDFSAYLKETDAQARVKPVSAWMADLRERLHSKKTERATRLPWTKCADSFHFRDSEVSLWSGQNGHGKALCVNTKIPTPSGWSTMLELKAGDQVFDENGNVCNVVAATDVMQGRPCYLVTFDDGSSIIADEQHEWLTDCSRSRNSERTSRDNGRLSGRDLKKRGSDQSHKKITAKIRTTKEISETLLVSGKSYNGTKNHSIKNAKPLHLPEAPIPIDAYCLGAWLGDGSSSGAQITSADQFIVDMFSLAGVSVTKCSAKYLYGLTGGFLAALKSCGLINNKHIPEIYLRASFDQRLNLLQGLMDTDGHVTNYGRCEYTGVNKTLCYGVLELCLSLGIKAKMIFGRATLYGKDCGEKYRITFTTSLPVFQLPRKLKFIKEKLSPVTQSRYIVSCRAIDSVPVKCIEVDSPSNLYLASESFIPTHNSLITSQVALSLIGQGERVCIASFEMKPVVTLQRMARMFTGMNPFSPEFQGEQGVELMNQLYDEFAGFTKDRMWLYDQTGTAEPDKIIGMVRYCAKELKINHVFIDNLAKCVKGEDDYNGQKSFVDELTAVARDNNIHIHLVHHLKKPANENSVPDKHDNKGSGSITDQVDNVFMVWRNKAKEDDAKLNGPTGKKAAEPDHYLLCRKQRNYEGSGEGEPTIMLWFNRDAQQYIGNYGDAPMYFPNWPHEQTKY